MKKYNRFVISKVRIDEMNLNLPLISIIIPSYNSEKYILDCLNSISEQSFKNFECIIVNDGSTDKSVEIINSFVNKDLRFKIMNKLNSGVGDSIRIGVNESKGKYIARIDSDDIANKDRLLKQFHFMENNDEVIVLGSNMQLFSENIEISKTNYFTNHIKIKWRLFFDVPVGHPSVIIRKKELIEVGSYKDLVVEDYELWTRFVMNDFVIMNLKDCLTNYRIHNLQITKNFIINERAIEEFYIHKEKYHASYNLNYSHLHYEFDNDWKKFRTHPLCDKKRVQKEIVERFYSFFNLYYDDMNLHTKFFILFHNYKLLIKLNYNFRMKIITNLFSGFSILTTLFLKELIKKELMKQ